MATFEDAAKGVLEGDADKVQSLCEQLLKEGHEPLDIINDALVAGMNEVGILFKANEMYVPEVIASAEAMERGTGVVKALINTEDIPCLGTVLLGTVKGDLHDIGKNLVKIMLEGAGFKVIDLGTDVPPERFVEEVKDNNPNIVAMSALLTTTMLSMKDTIEVLQEEGLRDDLKIVIGGAPVSEDFSNEISADGYSADAITAVDICKNLMGIA